MECWMTCGTLRDVMTWIRLGMHCLMTTLVTIVSGRQSDIDNCFTCLDQ